MGQPYMHVQLDPAAVTIIDDADGDWFRGPCAIEALQSELHNYSRSEHVIGLDLHANGSPSRGTLFAC